MPLREVFGYNTDGEVGDQVLMGQFDLTNGMEEYTRDILSEVAWTQWVIPEDSVSSTILSKD